MNVMSCKVECNKRSEVMRHIGPADNASCIIACDLMQRKAFTAIRFIRELADVPKAKRMQVLLDH